MRSPHNPQPTVSLGDDPDPASELGPRLAATSQAVQGLLTNYLFYGQRRSSDPVTAAVQALAVERDHEQHREDARASLADQTRQSIGSRPGDRREASGPTHGASSGQAVSPVGASGVPRLQLVVPPEPPAESSGRIAPDVSTAPTDPLAKDVLTDDPLAHDALESRHEDALGEDVHQHTHHTP